MTDAQLAVYDIPQEFLGDVKALIEIVQQHNATNSHQYDIEELIFELAEDPVYFVLEGGSDGTWSNNVFHVKFGPIKKPLTDVAAKIARSNPEKYGSW